MGLLEEISAGLQALYELTTFVMAEGGPLGLFFAMIIQAIIFPIPSESILLLAGASFPKKYGLYLGLTYAIVFGFLGSLAGGIIAFYISRIGGYPIVQKLVSDEDLEAANVWFEKYGIWAVLIGRLMPFVPFDAISYGAGLSPMRTRDFVIPTIIGLIPRVIFYTILGYMGDWILKDHFELGLLLALLLVIGFYVLYRFTFSRMRSSAKLSKEEETQESEQEAVDESSSTNDKGMDALQSIDDKSA